MSVTTTDAGPANGTTAATASDDVEVEITEVRAVGTGEHGRYVISAEGKAFLSDSVSREGGPVAPAPTDHLLSALAVCVLGSVGTRAGELELPVPATVATVTSERDVEDRTRFAAIRVVAHVPGVDEATGRELVHHFTSRCPIYNTIRRGGPISVDLVVDGQEPVRVDESGRFVGPA